MAGRIREESIAAVREATDVVGLIGEYVALRAAGGTRMKGLCPFHQERTPSFHVDTARGLYHCFGCGEGGDAIDFLMKQDSMTFTEAVERLAQRAGIELSYTGRSAGERGSLGRRSRLVAAHTAAVEFYADQLRSSPEAGRAREYLGRRGLDAAAGAERFRLGWAPAGSWEALAGHLRGRGFRTEELLEAGLIRPGSRGLRDTFHARVMFPIFDVAGDPVAFGGRVLEPGPGPQRAEDAGPAPKYLNSAESPIWHKGRVLYALNWAKRAIVRAGFAVVVEGYTDVIALQLAGFEQAVATCGTALRAEHFRLLAKFTTRVVLAFDADTAGARAAERGIGELLSVPEAALSAQVIALPEGLDPAELVARRGGASFAELVERAQPLVRWWLDWNLARFDLRNPEGRARASHALLPVLRAVPDELQRTEYARSVVQRLHLDETEYLTMVRGQRPAAVSGARPAPSRRSVEARVEHEALKLVLQHPEWVGGDFDTWGPDWFTTSGGSACYAAVVKAGGIGAPLDAVLDAAGTEAERRVIRGLAVEAFAAEENRRYAVQVLRRLGELRLGREIESVKGTLQRMNPVEQADEYTRTFGELIALEARRRALREPRP